MPGRIASYKTAAIAQGAAGTTAILAAPGAGYRIIVLNYCFTMSLDGTAKFVDTVGGDLSGAMDILGKGGVAIAAGDEEAPIFVLAANGGLSITTTLGAAKGHIAYAVEPV